MAGITVNEGLEYVGNTLYKAGTQETLILGLFTNPLIPDGGSLKATSTWASVTQPAGSGYAEITLVAGTFTVSALGVVTYPQQQWTAGDTWTGGDVYGYYIRNDNVSPVLVHVEYRDGGLSFEMLNGRIYAVDLSVDTS